MKQIQFIILVLFIYFFGFQNAVFSQQVFTDEKRAEYIFSFSQNVTWQNPTNSVFRLGILDKDSLLYYMIEAQSEKIQTIHKKNIKVLLFHSIQDITPTDVLFLEFANNYDIELVNKTIESNKTLLLSEGFPFHKSMINFTVTNGKRHYEINQKKLQEIQVTVNPLLVKNAIKTKEDWESLFAKTEVLLEKEIDINNENLKIINSQTENIAHQKNQIKDLEKSVTTQKKELEILTNSINSKQIELNKTLQEITKRSNEIEIQELQLTSLKKNVSKQQKVLKEQSTQLHSQNSLLLQQFDKIKTQKLVIYLSVSILLIILFFSIILIRLLQKTKQFNLALQQKNHEIHLQNEQIALQNKEITDSIVYARRIQHAILPPQEIIKDCIPEHFILFKPRDIVSGDYYWMTQIDNKIIITAADCTGHGVPGAFMSLLGITFLNEIVHEKKITKTNDILNQLRERIIDSLNRNSKTEDYKDGMDMAICMINKSTLELEYSGAYNSLYFIRNGELKEIKADKMPVGLSEKNHESFTTQTQKLEKNDSFYMFSDGYADQFGGPNDKKFMSKSFKELLISIQHKSMNEQKRILDSTIEEWRGTTEQVDDILVIGLKI